MFGKPVIKGTRLPVEIIVEKMAYGYTILKILVTTQPQNVIYLSHSKKKILKEYPFITEEDIKAALLFAAKVVSREEVYSF